MSSVHTHTHTHTHTHKAATTTTAAPTTTTTTKASSLQATPAWSPQLTAYRTSDSTPAQPNVQTSTPSSVLAVPGGIPGGNDDPSLDPGRDRHQRGCAAGAGTTATTAPGGSNGYQNKVVNAERAVLDQRVGPRHGEQAGAGGRATEDRYQGHRAGPMPERPVVESEAILALDAWVRLLLGLLVGLILGILATWLLDGLDRRIRTTKRAEEVFRLPVISEIPAPESKSLSAVPVVDIVVDPYSPYRRPTASSTWPSSRRRR